MGTGPAALLHEVVDRRGPARTAPAPPSSTAALRAELRRARRPGRAGRRPWSPASLAARRPGGRRSGRTTRLDRPLPRRPRRRTGAGLPEPPPLRPGAGRARGPQRRPRPCVGDAAHLDRLRAAGVELPALDWDAWDRAVAAAAACAPRRRGRAPSVDRRPTRRRGCSSPAARPAAPKGARAHPPSLLAAVAASAAGPAGGRRRRLPLPVPALPRRRPTTCVHRHAHGRPVVLVDGFDPAAFCAAVEAERVTSTSLAATMLAALLDHVDGRARRRSDQLRHPAVGRLRRRADGRRPCCGGPTTVLGVGLAQGYGMTELSGNAVFLDAAAHRRGLAGDERLLRAAGRPAPGVEVRIADDADRRAARGRRRARRDGGDPRAGPAGDGRLLGRSRRPPPPPCATGGSAPATSVGSTPTACCSSSTAARTSSSPGARTCRPRRSRTCC